MITNNAESSDHGSEARLALDWDERLTPASAWHQVLIEVTTQQHQPGSYQAVASKADVGIVSTFT